MIKRGKHLIRSHMTLEYEFTGIRLQEGTLTPVDWHLSVDLVAPGKRGRNKEEIEHEAGITYQKIYFWLDTNLPHIVVADASDEDDLYIANLSSNIMMYCPGNPSDDTIIQLLHAKLTALGSPNLVVGEMHLKGSDTSLQYTFDCPDAEYTLPVLTVEYYPEGTCRDVVPWWFRDDGFCFEFVRPEEDEDSKEPKITDEELFKDIVDPMTEFQSIISEMSESRINITREPARIVQVEKWKPKKV